MNGIPLTFVMVASLATVAEGQTPVKPPILDIPPEPLRIVSSEDGENPRVAEGLSPSYASKLPECDRIEVFLLAGDLQHGTDADRFPIRPYNGTSKIVERKDLKGADASKLCSLWRGLTFDNKAAVLSHSSAYGLRFYRAGKLVFETSVSFSCHNFYYPRTAFPSMPGVYSWHGFRTCDEAGKALFAFLNATLPMTAEKPKTHKAWMSTAQPLSKFTPISPQ